MNIIELDILLARICDDCDTNQDVRALCRELAAEYLCTTQVAS